MKALLPFCLAMGAAAAVVSAESPPARTVTAYALTTGIDSLQSNPTGWRLLGSNDGRDWQVLDERDNLEARYGERMVFYIENTTPHRFHRLEFDANQSGGNRGIALAEVEFAGPVVGVEREADLRAIVTSSQENPLAGSAWNAFDGHVASKWIDFAPFGDGTCWIQCEYVRDAVITVSTVRELQVAEKLLSTRTRIAEAAPEILARLDEGSTGRERMLSGYALTSANDHPARDPRDWKILGSNDGGRTWEVVDERRNQVFTSRFQRRVFTLPEPAAHALYRFQVDAIAQHGRAYATQLAEFEPLYASELEEPVSLVISADAENPPMESIEMAFDGDSRSKWLSHWVPGKVNYWLQWHPIPTIEGLPLVNQDVLEKLRARQFADRPLQPVRRKLTAYALTSGADEPDRDPRDWTLQGSNDGEVWATIDVRRGEAFAGRLERRLFEVENPAEFCMYRLQVDGVASRDGQMVQITEIEPIYAASEGANGYSTRVRAEGEMLPREGVDRAFDSSLETKWLDPGWGKRRTAWVEWSLFEEAGRAVSRDDGYSWIQPDIPRVEIDLEAAVAGAEGGMAGLLDETGFDMVDIDADDAELAAGAVIRVTGRLRFLAERVAVENASVERVGALEMADGERLENMGPGFVLGVLEGRTGPSSAGGDYDAFTLRASVDSPGITVRVLRFANAHLRMRPGRVKVRGIVEPVIDDGRRVPGTLWAASPDAIEWLPSGRPARNDDEMSRENLQVVEPVESLARIREILEQQPGRELKVKVQGVITYIDRGLFHWYLQDGDDGILMQDQLGAGLGPFLGQEGLLVEVEGRISSLRDGIVPEKFVKVLGKGRLPPPPRRTLDELMTGSDNARWVQVEGVVTGVEKHRLMLRVPGGQLVAWIGELDESLQNRLLGAAVRVSGVCTNVRNSRGQRLGVRLLVPSAEQVEVLRATPEDPFALEESTSIGEIMQGDVVQEGARMLKTSGVVTHVGTGVLFVQDGDAAVRVLPRNDAKVSPGDRVDVVGMAEPDGLAPRIVQAVVRTTGSGPLPAAVSLDRQLVDFDETGIDADATRVSLEATVAGRTFQDNRQIVELRQSGDRTVYAEMPKEPDLLEMAPAGSRVVVTGVFKARTDAVPDVGQVVTSFDMYVNSVADVKVLQRPPWWTSEHTMWTLAGLGTVLAVSLSWAGLLRRQVRRQTHVLREEIAERERSEEALKLTQFAVDQSADAMFWIGADMQFLYVNDAACTLLGRTRDELMEMTLPGVDANFSRADWAAFWEATRREGNRVFESRYRTKDRGLAAVEVTVSHFKYGRNEMICASARDIAERQRMLDELEEARDLALESARLKAEFLANMSHEIRTPMNGVIGTVDLLRHTRLDEEQREYVETISRSGDTLLTVINDILDFSKIDAGKLKFERIDFDPREEVNGTLALLEPAARGKGLELRSQIDPVTPRRVRGDPARLRQVLNNLLNNAVKFTSEGGVTLRVGPGPAVERGVCLRFEVEDTGIGIAEEGRKSLFDAFSQADSSTTRKYGGTGLGLAIASRLVQLMDGEISVDSVPGNGSIFWFTARFERPAAERGRGADPVVREDQSPRRRSLRVLLAEDNEVNRKVVLGQLAKLGCRADVAADGAEALEAVQRKSYDVVLMDCQMPGIDGYEATRKIRELGIPVRIVALTAHAMQGDREKCLEAGMDDYLMKPLRLADLGAALARCPISDAISQ